MISNNSKLRFFTATALVACLWALIFYCPPILFSIALFAAMCVMIAELKSMVHNSYNFLRLLPFYPIIPCLILIYFNQNPNYRILLSSIFITVFSFDSGSYLVGSLCSKFWTTSKIVPAISPGKSWEGACGGYIITTAIFLTISKLNNLEINPQILALSAIICVIAFAGDIFESFLKRSAGIKDSGTLLPGHGGFLDRFDAILFVSYFFFIFKNNLVKILSPL